MVSTSRPLALLSLCRSASSFLATRRLYIGSGLIASSSIFGGKSATACASSGAPSMRTSTMAQASTSAATSTKDDPVSRITGYLNAEDAAALDRELMSTPGFSLEQLMELAGLSVAECVYDVVEGQRKSNDKKPHILIIVGPGNNGGDGLVAARHLVMFGYSATVVYPKQSSKQHFVNLVQQCRDVDVDILTELPKDLLQYNSKYTAIVDAIFGFSFHGTPREPFASILTSMQQAQTKYGLTTVSVDIPSGWNVDQGDEANTGFNPDVLISLTTPKLSAKFFQGRHFVGGRFLPNKFAEKYGVKMPPYPGVSQIMELPSANREESWEEGYAAYCTEKESRLSAKDAEATEQASEEESWEAQYVAYLAEKEAKEFGRS